MSIPPRARCTLLAMIAFLSPALQAFGARPSASKSASRGVAGWYHPKFEGRTTANGERFTNEGLTCAHRTFPFGTRLRVTNVRNGKSVVVRVNDRGPFMRGRGLDLTKRAAAALGFVREGIATVTMEPLAVAGQ